MQAQTTVTTSTDNSNMNFDVVKDNAMGDKSKIVAAQVTRDQSLGTIEQTQINSIGSLNEKIDQEKTGTQTAIDTAMGDYNIAKDNALNNSKAATRDTAIESATIAIDNALGQDQVTKDKAYEQADVTKDNSDGTVKVTRDQAMATAWQS
jgi:hypothetical protein